MKESVTKFMLIAFVIGFLMACVSLSAKFWSDTGGSPNITCSSDGKYIYTVDSYYLYKSDDFGKTWRKIDVADIVTD